MDDLGMDGTRDAVMEFCIQLGERIYVVHRRVGDIPDRGGLDDIANDKLLDRFVLGSAPRAIGTADRLHVTAPFLRTSVVSPFLRHF